MPEELPFFKYHPNPIATGAITVQSTLCPVCGEKRLYTYVGPFFTIEEVEGICPWCIKDGSAAKKFDGEFQDAASCEPVHDEAYLMELTTQTPGYSGWQQEVWLSHCGDFCAFQGYVGWDDIEQFALELRGDIDQIKNDMRLSDEEFTQSLTNGGTHQGYLFKCIHCGQLRLASDLD